jgi:hypothetical protein
MNKVHKRDQVKSLGEAYKRRAIDGAFSEHASNADATPLGASRWITKEESENEAVSTTASTQLAAPDPAPNISGPEVFK